MVEEGHDSREVAFMPLLVFLIWFIPTLLTIRRVRFWQAVGQKRHARRLHRAASFLLSAAVFLCMSTQMYLLARMGLLGVGTALPLHLCSFTGILTPFMLLSKSKGMLEFSLFLGVPGAALALIFPAILPSPWPILMGAAFLSLHAILTLAPFLRMADGTRPRAHAWGFVFLWGNLLLLAVIAVNKQLGTNYFFMRLAPSGTPLALLQGMGQAVYVAALEAAALILLKLEGLAYGKVMERRHDKVDREGVF
jgi:hypothetical integral membrane protein (TIGR02206 family)